MVFNRKLSEITFPDLLNLVEIYLQKMIKEDRLKKSLDNFDSKKQPINIWSRKDIVFKDIIALKILTNKRDILDS